jgi:hypothetical protein
VGVRLGYSIVTQSLCNRGILPVLSSTPLACSSKAAASLSA